MNYSYISIILLTSLITNTFISNASDFPNHNKRMRPADFDQQINLQPNQQMRRIENLNRTNNTQNNTEQNQINNSSINNTLTLLHAISRNIQENTTLSLEQRESSNNNPVPNPIPPTKPEIENCNTLLNDILAFAYPEVANKTLKEKIEYASNEDQLTLDYINSKPSEQIQALSQLWQELYNSEEDEDFEDETEVAQRISLLVQRLLPLSASQYIAAVMIKKIKETPISTSLQAKILQETALLWRPFWSHSQVRENITQIITKGIKDKTEKETCFAILNQTTTSLSSEQKDHLLAAEILIQADGKRSHTTLQKILEHISILPAEEQVTFLFKNFEKFNLRKLNHRLTTLAAIFTWIEQVTPKLQNHFIIQQLARIIARFTLPKPKKPIENLQTISTEKCKEEIVAYADLLKQQTLLNKYMRDITGQSSKSDKTDTSTKKISEKILHQMQQIILLSDEDLLFTIANSKNLAHEVFYHFGKNISDVFISRTSYETNHFSKMLELISSHSNDAETLILFLKRIQQINDTKKITELLAPIFFAHIKNLEALHLYLDILSTLPQEEQKSILFRRRTNPQVYYTLENKILISPEISNKFFDIVKKLDDKGKEQLIGSNIYLDILTAYNATNFMERQREYYITNIPLQKFLNEFILSIQDHALQTAILSLPQVVEQYLLNQDPATFSLIFSYLDKINLEEQSIIIKSLLNSLSTYSSLPLNIEIFAHTKNYRHNKAFLNILDWIAKKSDSMGLQLLAQSKKTILLLFQRYNTFCQHQKNHLPSNTLYNLFMRYLNLETTTIKCKRTQAHLAALLVSLNQKIFYNFDQNVLNELNNLINNAWQKTQDDKNFMDLFIDNFINDRARLIPLYTPTTYIHQSSNWSQIHTLFMHLLNGLFYKSPSGLIKTNGFTSRTLKEEFIQKIQSYYPQSVITYHIRSKIIEKKITLSSKEKSDLEEAVFDIFNFIFTAAQEHIRETSEENTMRKSLFLSANQSIKENTKLKEPTKLIQFLKDLEKPSNKHIKTAVESILTSEVVSLFHVLTSGIKSNPKPRTNFGDIDIFFN